MRELSVGVPSARRRMPPSLLTTALSLAMACVLFRLAWPHAGALVGAAALGISFYPLQRWMRRRLPNRGPSVRAGLTTVLVVLFFVTPLLGMAWAALAQAGNWLPTARSWRGTVAQWREGTIVDSGPAMKVFRGWMERTFEVSPPRLRREVARVVENVLDSTVGATANYPSVMVTCLIETGLMVLALFFVFRDGEKMYSRFQEYLPLSDLQKAASSEKIEGMVTGVVRGWLLCAVIQGVLSTAAYGAAGLKGWILLGCATMLAGLLPLLGTALVWVPLSLMELTGGHIGIGIFLALWGIFVVTVTDNFLRPYFIGHRVKTPFVFLFFSLLGGLELWGVKGLILGPVLVALAPVIFEVGKYRRMENRELPLTESLGPDGVTSERDPVSTLKGGMAEITGPGDRGRGHHA